MRWFCRLGFHKWYKHAGKCLYCGIRDTYWDGV